MGHNWLTRLFCIQTLFLVLSFWILILKQLLLIEQANAFLHYFNFTVILLIFSYQPRLKVKANLFRWGSYAIFARSSKFKESHSEANSQMCVLGIKLTRIQNQNECQNDKWACWKAWRICQIRGQSDQYNCTGNL